MVRFLKSESLYLKVKKFNRDNNFIVIFKGNVVFMTPKYLLSFCKISLLITLFTTGAFSQNKAYKGAEVYSKSPYNIKYGKIDVRMMVAKGGGILSTFFLWKEGSEQPGVFWEEVDVEVFGKYNAITWQSNIISGLDPVKTTEQRHNQSFSLGDDFHTYSVEWTPEYVSWSLDGQLIRSISGAPATDITSPTGIRFNLWASTSLEWAGAWYDSVLPQYQFVNWIKYYRFEDDQFILDWTDDFSDFNSDRWAKANWTFDGNRVDFDPQNALVQDGMLILCLTKSAATGFSGEVPTDSLGVINALNKEKVVPDNLVLMQNYPNPFNPTTIISFTVGANHDSPLHVELSIYNLLGQKVATLVSEKKIPGSYSFKWDSGSLNSGVYLYKLQAGDFQQTKKMILIR